MTGECRAAGIRRIYGSYNGGGDEGFTDLDGGEMKDGRVADPRTLINEPPRIDFSALTENAIFAIVGDGFGTGNFDLRGAVVIDFEACTITDEKDADVVFGRKAAWVK